MATKRNVILLLIGFLSIPCFCLAETYQEQDIFVSGTGGVHTYRVPVIVTTQSGTLLAFCEARKIDDSDGSPTAIVMRRSTDFGQTWGSIVTLVDEGDLAMMAPTPVIDEIHETVFLFVKNRTYQRVLVMKSEDDGLTWTTPSDITSQTGNVGLGPNSGIQMKNGRLVIPVASSYRSHVVYSDDFGRSWNSGQRVDTPDGTNECAVVELVNGQLMLNMRTNDIKGYRLVALSNDGGLTWGAPYGDTALIDPRCNASIHRLTRQDEGYKNNRILFSNCARDYPSNMTNRKDLTVRVSYDEGQTWPISRLIHDQLAGYSNLTILPDNSIGLLYEKGDATTAFQTVSFVRFDIGWLTQGLDRIFEVESNSDKKTVEEFGNVADIMSVANSVGVDFKDYVLPNPEVDNAVRVSAPSPFTGFVEPNAIYSSSAPLPNPVGILLNAYWNDELVNVLFKDGSTNRTYSPLYGIREPYAGYSRLEILFVSPNSTDWANPIIAEVSHVGFVFESVTAGAIDLDFFDKDGKILPSIIGTVPDGSGEISYVCKDSAGNPTTGIHKIVFSARLGNDLQDYWSIGSTVGLPIDETGLAYANFTAYIPCPTADLNGDCVVNVFDLMIMAQEWLQ